jgi:integrase/recombinase XerC
MHNAEPPKPTPAFLAQIEPTGAIELARSPLEIAVAAWLDSKTGLSGSQRTRDSYATTLADARASLHVVRLELDGEPRAVALALQGWSRSSKTGRTVKPATVAQRLAVVASFYQFTIRRGLLPELMSNPADMVERPKVESYAEAQALDPTTVRQVLAQLRQSAAGDGPDDPSAARDLALLRVALVTGRRVAELAALRWTDVQVTGDAKRVTLTFRRAKGGKVMRDLLPTSVAGDLLRWLHRHYGAELGQLPTDAPLWPALQPNQHAPAGGPMGERGIRVMVHARLGAHPHQLRHSFAHDMRRAGAKDSEVQARLGHANLATTGRYLAALAKAENPYGDALAAFYSDGQID